MANDTTDISLERGGRGQHSGVKKWGADGEGGRGERRAGLTTAAPWNGDSPDTKNGFVPLDLNKKTKIRKDFF